MTSKEALERLWLRYNGTAMEEEYKIVLNDLEILEALKKPFKEFYKNEYYLITHAWWNGNYINYEHTMYHNGKQVLHAPNMIRQMPIEECIQIVKK